MPDAHWGKGSTVGSVIPTRGAIIPAAVGVDIGCGLTAMQLDIATAELLDLKELRARIEKAIPRGKGQNNSETGAVGSAITQLEGQLPSWLDPDSFSMNWRYQIGTLGGGNHFLEVDEDENGYVWLVLHSGSRNIGLRMATHFIDLSKQAGQPDLPNADLAYLTEGTTEFDQYIDIVNWAQEYAFENRKEMMRRMREAVVRQVNFYPTVLQHFDVHHNYTTKETHYGQDVWVTRKGAIRAQEGDTAIIPGSMGTHSFIVTGRGNPEALSSAPHGAGRTMSRGQARKRITLEEMQAAMTGIECNVHKGVLDEAPGAYKDISVVMNDAADLVDIKHTLKPILNIKG
jgi:tRNA-splicing ligase RtcB